MSITSWPGPGVGGGTSSSLRSSTGPHARQITALIHPEEYTGEAPCGGRDTDADCGGSSSRQRRSTTIEPVRVYMRVPGTQPMPRLVRLRPAIQGGGFGRGGVPWRPPPPPAPFACPCSRGPPHPSPPPLPP